MATKELRKTLFNATVAMTLQADLQTSSQRLALSSGAGDARDELAQDESIDDVIQHEVKELGTHMYANISSSTDKHASPVSNTCIL